MFENVYGRTHERTDGRTPDRPVYYKLTLSGELKNENDNSPTFQFGRQETGKFRAGPRDVVARGALKAKVLNQEAKAARGGV